MTVTEYASGFTFRRGARWIVDLDRTEIRFSVGLMKITTVEGRFGRVRGSIVLDDGAPHWSRVDMSIEAASIDTSNAVRDFHLRTGDYLDSGRFPCIAFESDHVVPLDDTTYRVIGDLTIRGVAREVSLDVVNEEDIVELGTRRRRFSAQTKIDRKDFGVDPGSAGFGFLIGNEVTLQVRGEAIEQATDGDSHPGEEVRRCTSQWIPGS